MCSYPWDVWGQENMRETSEKECRMMFPILTWFSCSSQPTKKLTEKLYREISRKIYWKRDISLSLRSYYHTGKRKLLTHSFIHSFSQSFIHSFLSLHLQEAPLLKSLIYKELIQTIRKKRNLIKCWPKNIHRDFTEKEMERLAQHMKG